MMPCSSGNSYTICVTRSNLQMSAARLISSVRLRRPVRDAAGNPPASPDAPHLVGHRAEFLMIDDRLQLGQRIVDRQLLVFLIEELRVGQPRAQHFLVALGYTLDATCGRRCAP